MKTVLETRRLILREMTREDLDFLAEMLGDAEVMRHFPKPISREEALAYIEKNLARYAQDGYGFWVALDKETQLPIGRVGLLRQHVDGRDEDEIGYMIHRPYWRQGFASEAGAAVRDYAFSKLGKQRLISLVRPVNIPSQRTALKLGMKPEKLAMHASFEHIVFAIGSTE